MKKALKIIGITFGSIVGIIVIALSIALWVVFTPERLTPVLKKTMGEYITCQWEMGEVELTFFSTFPEFGLRVDGFTLINPMEGAQSDTILTTTSVVARFDVIEYAKHNNIIIRELSFQDVIANIYINAAGENNISVFNLASDTTTKDSTFSLPFDQLVVQSCILNAHHLSFVDERDSISTWLANTELALTIETLDNAHLQLSSENVNLQMYGETYAQNMSLQLDIPASVDLEKMYFKLNNAQLSFNELSFMVDGETTIGDTIAVNANIVLEDWNIQSMLTALPFIQESLTDISINGLLSMDASVTGVYSDSVLPLIDAHVKIADGLGSYAELPYDFTNLQVDADVHLDLNQKSLTHVTFHHLIATTKQTKLNISGSINDLFGEQITQAQIALESYIPDLAYFLPDSVIIRGRMSGNVNLKTCLADLTTNKMDRLSVAGKLKLRDLDVQMDSMQVKLSDGNLTFDTQWDEWPLIKADIDLQSPKLLTYTSDSINAQILAPKLHAYAAYDMEDTTRIPTFDTDLEFNNLEGQYYTYSAHMGATEIKGKMTCSRRSQSIPVFSGTLSSGNLSIQEGGNYISTKNIFLNAKARYKKDGSNFLLQWNPMLKFMLNGAEIDLEDFSHHITIPQIAFNYNNRDFDIISSNIILGRSDFSLTGDIHHIGKWLMDKADLTGNLNFTSNHTDVNELMTIFSADTGSEETPNTTTATEPKDTTGNPFLVPNNIDITLNTHINEAEVFNQFAKNLKGKVYIKDGTLVLEEMGFVCDAAKLQLTAMYRTPRRNHIYVGLDYHMLDVKIDQLIGMIPQIDSMIPMLKSFKGEAEFHLAGETYLKSNYDIKTSTIRGACSIFGKDLVLMDSETFDKISKILMFKKKTENVVDSISAEITLYKDEVEVYPFTVSMDNYMVAIGGKHKLDMSFNYHVNLLSPLYIGVDVTGTTDNLNIKAANCIYAKDFKPVIRNKTDTHNAELRQMIRNSLRKNVKIQ